MKNIKKKLLMSAALLSAAAPLLSEQHVQTVEASPVGEHVKRVGSGVYTTADLIDMPLVIEMLPTHVDYDYFLHYGFHQNRRVFMYLQKYKDSVYYYSPAVRYLHTDASKNGERPDGSIDEFARARLKTLSLIDGGRYYPRRNMSEHQLRANRGRGATESEIGGIGHHPDHHNRLTDPAKTVRDLNYLHPGSDKRNHNMRPYSVRPLMERAWTPENLIRTSTGYPTRHQDTRYTRGAYNAWVEQRSLGYYANGRRLTNPNFPADGMRDNGSEGFEDYPLLAFPWSDNDVRDGGNPSLHSEADEYTYQWAMHNGWYGRSRRNTHYDARTDWGEARTQYREKRAAMTILYDEHSSVQENMRRAGYRNRNSAIDALTVKYGSLQSPPILSTHTIGVTFKRATNDYVIGATAPTGPNDDLGPIDTRVVRQRVFNEAGNVIQTFEAGKALRPSKAPDVEPDDRLRVETDVVIHNGWRSAMHGVLDFSTNQNQTKTLSRIGGGNIRSGRIGTNRFSHTFTVPEMEGAYDVTTALDQALYASTSDITLMSGSYSGHNRLNVVIDRGDFASESISLIDREGNEVSTPVPGREYKIKYAFKYTSANGENARRKANLRVDYVIGREMVGENLGREDSGLLSAPGKTVRPEHGRTYTFETDYHLFETAQFDTAAALSVSEDRYNQDPSTNAIAERWSSNYDLGVSDVRLLPGYTVNTHEQTATVLVQFDVKYDAPSAISDLGQDVDFLVAVDDQVVEVTEHIRKGNNYNLSVPIEVELDGESDRVLEAVVFANHSMNVYESDLDAQRNNFGMATARIATPEVESFTNNNRRVTWNQYTGINRWTGENTSYNTFGGNRRNFMKFLNPDDSRGVRRDSFESYQVDAVRFRSRLTRMEEMGENGDGWVNLLEEEGYIRAGYGYELEVDVSYRTNVLDFSEPNRTGADGISTRTRFAEPLLQDNVYIEMPDGQLRSVQGDGGTESALRLKEKQGDAGNMSWTFEIDGGESLGAETVGRFYIGNDVEDGRYSLNVFTPRISGVSGKMTSERDVLEHLLYDSAPDLGINVIGSSVDDVTDHINR